MLSATSPLRDDAKPSPPVPPTRPGKHPPPMQLRDEKTHAHTTASNPIRQEGPRARQRDTHTWQVLLQATAQTLNHLSPHLALPAALCCCALLTAKMYHPGRCPAGYSCAFTPRADTIHEVR